MQKLPLTFTPLYQERVWGGRELENVYNRTLPKEGVPFGESWEITDRPDEQSVVCAGPLAGKSLHQLWSEQREEIFGAGFTSERFPLLIKILDARDDLSIQVHPPVELAAELNGEPKTEMWYIADVAPDSNIYVGLKNGVTKESFEKALTDGTCEEQVHAIAPKAGESIHIPSGRIHAIGAGLLIYEIQQNSDTTYRVYDWNRVGLDGVPRELHVEESMQCIDFNDFEPEMDTPKGNTIALCEYYHVRQLDLAAGETVGNPEADRFSIVTIVSGEVFDSAGNSYIAGDFMILPVGADPLVAQSDTRLLVTTVPR